MGHRPTRHRTSRCKIVIDPSTTGGVAAVEGHEQKTKYSEVESIVQRNDNPPDVQSSEPTLVNNLVPLEIPLDDGEDHNCSQDENSNPNVDPFIRNVSPEESKGILELEEITIFMENFTCSAPPRHKRQQGEG